MPPRKHPIAALPDPVQPPSPSPPPTPGPDCSHCERTLHQDFAYVRCAHEACDSIPICVDCFRVGAADDYPHRPNHPYRVIERVDTPIYEAEWSAMHEERLLLAIADAGPHHWPDVADEVGKSARDCERHYKAVYHCGANAPLATSLLPISGPTSYFPVPPHKPQVMPCAPLAGYDKLKSNVPISIYPSTPIAMPVPLPVPLPAPALAAASVQSSSESDTESVHPDPNYGNHTKVDGFMPLRADLDVEFDDNAEDLIADISISPSDTAEETALKVRLLEMYDIRVKRRESIRNFMLERDMFTFKNIKFTDRRSARDEKELIARLKIFARLLPNAEFQAFQTSVLKQYRMSRELFRLERCREAGMKCRAEIDVYEVERKARAAHLVTASKKQYARSESAPDSSRKKRAASLKRRRATSDGRALPSPSTPGTPGTPGTPATPVSLDVNERDTEDGNPSPANSFASNVVPSPTDVVTGVYAVDQSMHDADGGSSAAALRQARQRRRLAKSPYPQLEAMPLDGLRGLKELSPTERTLCSMLHIAPTEFLCKRDAMLHAAAQHREAPDELDGDEGASSVLALRCTSLQRPGPASAGVDDCGEKGSVIGTIVEGSVGIPSTHSNTGMVAEQAQGMATHLDGSIAQDCGTFLNVAAAVAAAVCDADDNGRVASESQRLDLDPSAANLTNADGGFVFYHTNSAGGREHSARDHTVLNTAVPRFSMAVDENVAISYNGPARRADIGSTTKPVEKLKRGTQYDISDLEEGKGSIFAIEAGTEVEMISTPLYVSNLGHEGRIAEEGEICASAGNEVQAIADMTGMMVEVDTRAVGMLTGAMKSDDSIGEQLREALKVVGAKGDTSAPLNITCDTELNRVGSADNVEHVRAQDVPNIAAQTETVGIGSAEGYQEILVVSKRRPMGTGTHESGCVHSVKVRENVVRGTTLVKESHIGLTDAVETVGGAKGGLIKRSTVFVKAIDDGSNSITVSDGDEQGSIVKVERNLVKTEEFEATDSIRGKGFGSGRTTARKRRSVRRPTRRITESEDDDDSVAVVSSVPTKREGLLVDGDRVDGNTNIQRSPCEEAAIVIMSDGQESKEVEVVSKLSRGAKSSRAMVEVVESRSILLRLRLRPSRLKKMKRGGARSARGGRRRLQRNRSSGRCDDVLNVTEGIGPTATVNISVSGGDSGGTIIVPDDIQMVQSVHVHENQEIKHVELASAVGSVGSEEEIIEAGKGKDVELDSVDHSGRSDEEILDEGHANDENKDVVATPGLKTVLLDELTAPVNGGEVVEEDSDDAIVVVKHLKSDVHERRRSSRIHKRKRVDEDAADFEQKRPKRGDSRNGKLPTPVIVDGLLPVQVQTQCLYNAPKREVGSATRRSGRRSGSSRGGLAGAGVPGASDVTIVVTPGSGRGRPGNVGGSGAPVGDRKRLRKKS